MGSLHEANTSLWVATAGDLGESAAADLTSLFDVVVVGAGITGLTTARLLAREGASVAVVEAGEVAAGATGYTTAKITALQRTTLSEIREKLGSERAAMYAAANAAAVETIVGLVADDEIDCDLERAPACTYTVELEAVAAVEAEHDAAMAAGLATRLDTETELPFDVAAAVWLDDQAQFHPRRYCLGLARAIRDAGGVIVEGLRVRDVAEEERNCTITTETGTMTAAHVVIASHLPFMVAGGYFARAHPYRSYALAARTTGERVHGMYISSETPTRSIRSTPDGWTVLGGEGHKVGQDDDTRDRYQALGAWGRDKLGFDEIGYRWSAQDYETLDGMPYIGRLTDHRSRTWTATGFGKWGMTNGTVAAVILADLIADRANPWAEAFDSTRFTPGASIKSLITENLNVGKRLVADRVRTWSPRLAEDLAPGEGAIVDLDGETVAAYRDDDGTLHAVAATCTHLGCRVGFNTAERSWDCPCHGSRFSVDGEVLEGPAVKNLAPKTE